MQKKKKKKLKLNNILHFLFLIEIVVKFAFTEGFSAKKYWQGCDTHKTNDQILNTVKIRARGPS